MRGPAARLPPPRHIPAVCHRRCSSAARGGGRGRPPGGGAPGGRCGAEVRPGPGGRPQRPPPALLGAPPSSPVSERQGSGAKAYCSDGIQVQSRAGMQGNLAPVILRTKPQVEAESLRVLVFNVPALMINSRRPGDVRRRGQENFFALFLQFF